LLAWACAKDSPGVYVADDDGDQQSQASGGTAGDIFFVDDEDEPEPSGGGTSSVAPTNPDGTCGAPQSDSSCGSEVFEGASVPVDIHIVFDQSGSMCACLDPGAGQLCVEPCETTRLDAVRDAIETFMRDPNSAGIGVGLGLFGQQPIGSTSCDAASYGAPVVDIGTLPDRADTVTAALAELEPVGETPTGPALRGACEYARDYRITVPDHQVVLLLLTDGRPEAPTTCRGGAGQCCPTLDDAVVAADECRNQIGIRTYVLGVGPLLDNLDQIAAAGGTERAYLVQGGDVSAEVLTALNRIRGAAAIPCEMPLPAPPPGGALALDSVNLEYSANDCQVTPFASVQSAEQCGEEDGWYYDSADSPQRILLCPRSCERVSGPGGNLYYSVGCDTRIR
jgi:hypothetical protein